MQSACHALGNFRLPGSCVVATDLTLPRRIGQTSLEPETGPETLRSPHMTALSRSFLLAAAVLLATHAGAAEAKRPNILLIFADDQSYKTVSSYPEALP